VTIKVRMRCDLPDLAKILHVLETQSPSLRVTDLNLFQQVFTGVGGANMLGSMDIRFDLSGYIRKPGGQA
ncbi:MAG: general secretion pathway protein GspM, partial [Xanthomonadales bacterium]|nr:general secretion pathway protein GspM [Xanthomonadales bacterium]